jgi:sugar/nucleoside kinase (ribokinase family)
MNILVIGGVSFDTIVHLNRLPNGESQTMFGSDYQTIGSTGAGKALNLTKLGVNTTLHATLADDDYGNKIRKYLQNRGVQAVYDTDAFTERHVNLMDSEGKRISIFTASTTANPNIDWDRLEKLIISNDIIVLNIIPYTKKIIALIKKHHKTIWTDLHDYEEGNSYYDDFIEVADCIFFSSDKIVNHRQLMEKWIKMGKKMVVVTHGKNGASVATKDDFLYEPIINTYQLIDSNGAGDAFFAGFLYGFIKHESVQTCLAYGTIAGGVTVSSKELVSPLLSEDYLLKKYQEIYQ